MVSSWLGIPLDDGGRQSGIQIRVTVPNRALACKFGVQDLDQCPNECVLLPPNLADLLFTGEFVLVGFYASHWH